MKSENTYEKIVSFIDRMEFINHLSYVKNEAEHNKFIFDGKEVNGIDNDIDSLRLYLTLICIDIFASTHPYKTFYEWLLSNCDDCSSEMSIKEYINQKANKYEKDYGISSSFEKAFINASLSIKNSLVEN